MERAALERLQQMIDGEVEERFPEGAVRRVVLLQYGDDPVVEPGEVRARVVIPKDYKAGDEDWAQENRTRIMEFRRWLAERLPEVSGLEVILDGPGVPSGHWSSWYVGGGGWLRSGGGSELTAVMARLEPEDQNARRSDHRGRRGQPFRRRALGPGPHPRAASVREARRVGPRAR